MPGKNGIDEEGGQKPAGYGSIVDPLDPTESSAATTDDDYNGTVEDGHHEVEEERRFRMLKKLSSPLLSFSEPGWSLAQKRKQEDLLGDHQAHEDDTSHPSNFLLSFRYTMRDVGLKMLPYQEGSISHSVRDVGGKASVSNETLNLVKNIVGAGALALPSGVASFASSGTNISGLMVSASCWIVGMAAIFAYYFLLLGRICKITQTTTYAEAWERTAKHNSNKQANNNDNDNDNNHTTNDDSDEGSGGAGLVALAVALKAGMGNLECSMILADSFRDLFATCGVAVTRNTALLIVTFVALLPLCLLKNLAVLAPFSMVGIAAMAFTGIAIAIRYLDGSYDPTTTQGPNFLNDIADDLQPSFFSSDSTTSATMDTTDSPVLAQKLQVLVFLCMLSEAYIAHYNAPRFWIELKDRTVPRFGTVVGSSFGLSAAFYVFVAVFGFLTFGTNSSGMILDNYSTHDVLASISRACVGFALISGYPLIFVGFRDGILDLLMIPPDKQTAKTLNALTVLLLAIVTILAMVLTDLGIVTAVGGGALGTIVVFIVPTIMFCRAVKLLGPRATPQLHLETKFAWVLMWIGIAIGVIGVWLAL